MRKIIFSLLFVLLLQDAGSQNLTGYWEGSMSGGERLQVSIRMRNKEICGYTADQVIGDSHSYCKANYRGWYDKEEEVWVLVGTGFIENSGEHILMILRLWHQAGDPQDVLRGTEEAKYGSRSMFGMGNSRSTLRLKRTSKKLPADMPDCFPAIKKPQKPSPGKEASIKPTIKKKEPAVAKPLSKIPAPIKPKPPLTSRPVPPKAKPPVVKKQIVKSRDTLRAVGTDTVRKITKIAPLQVSNDPDLLKKMNARKKTEFSHIVVQEKNITLNVYDNGFVDNDSVSIFYNGRLIAGKKKLSEKPLLIHLQLDDDVQFHEIVMFAENLGSIPPNTALIVVTAGSKRYELHSSANLSENAVLTFEYKPN
ncbi:MAG: hypothetical protein ABIN36_19275 [Ferruginibacter sp.]